jgi:hypothetical protein
VHERLQQLLKEEAARSLVQSEYAVSNLDMMCGDPEQIVRRVRANLVQAAVAHAADNKLLDSPDALSMEKDAYHDVTRIRARLYMMTPAELESLLRRAFQAGGEAVLHTERPSPWCSEQFEANLPK